MLHDARIAARPLPAPGLTRRAARAVTLEALRWGIRILESVPPLRRRAVAAAERRLAGSSPGRASARNSDAVEADKRALGRAIVSLTDRALAEHRLSPPAMRGLLRVLVHDILLRRGEHSAKEVFRARRGCNPPDFLVLSPGKACNLACEGCYAASGPAREKLDWDTLERVVSEAHDEWGTRFFAVTGGEPLAYRSGGRGVLDLAERHPDCFFLMYTNGTLIDDGVARRLARAGNVTPALSLEGLRERTDERRGAGVFDDVMGAMERLRKHGVLFGASFTATRKNAEEILADETVETILAAGAAYAFIFHYMPIGRAFSLDLMMTPAQRMHLWERGWQLIRERRLFVADFWSGATATNGCVAAGRPGGYFHIDWNGAVSPCVFVPYSPVNIRDVFTLGGHLDDVWDDPFFASLRRWQRAYGYREKGERPDVLRNWLMPCPIRDHHREFLQILRAHDARPTGEDARLALEDPAYHEGMEAFGRELASLSDPVWSTRYAGDFEFRRREGSRS